LNGSQQDGHLSKNDDVVLTVLDIRSVVGPSLRTIAEFGEFDDCEQLGDYVN
jgi:hypothetical protein